jgi:classical protein kinase C/novel protein kinase C epsilon type
LKKEFISDERELQATQTEKSIFLTANRDKHPFLLNLHSCFQTESRICFVMEFVSGGDLLWHIEQQPFTETRVKFYAAEVLLALDYLHKNNIVYR